MTTGADGSGLAPGPPSDAVPRGGPELVPTAECWALLEGASVGRFAFVVDGWPVVLPVNYALDGEVVLLRTAEGAKLAAARDESRVALQVDSTEPLYRSGWSVLLFGWASEIHDSAELRRVSATALRPWAGGERWHWIKIVPVQVTGRRLPREWKYPDPLR